MASFFIRFWTRRLGKELEQEKTLRRLAEERLAEVRAGAYTRSPFCLVSAEEKVMASGELGDHRATYTALNNKSRRHAVSEPRAVRRMYPGTRTPSHDAAMKLRWPMVQERAHHVCRK